MPSFANIKGIFNGKDDYILDTTDLNVFTNTSVSCAPENVGVPLMMKNGTPVKYKHDKDVIHLGRYALPITSHIFIKGVKVTYR